MQNMRIVALIHPFMYAPFTPNEISHAIVLLVAIFCTHSSITVYLTYLSILGLALQHDNCICHLHLVVNSHTYCIEMLSCLLTYFLILCINDLIYLFPLPMNPPIVAIIHMQIRFSVARFKVFAVGTFFETKFK